MPPAGKDPVVLRKGNRIEEGHAEAARWPESRETEERGGKMGLAPSESDSGGAQWLLRGHEKRLLKVPGIRQLIIRIGGLTRGAKVYGGQRGKRRQYGWLFRLPLSENGLLSQFIRRALKGGKLW